MLYSLEEGFSITSKTTEHVFNTHTNYPLSPYFAFLGFSDLGAYILFQRWPVLHTLTFFISQIVIFSNNPFLDKTIH